MMQFAFVGISAGIAAALLFASVTAGTLLSIPLFYLAPLPIMIAGLGWGHWSALLAAVTGAAALGMVFGTVFLFAFLASAGVPAWWLGYLAMLARPEASGHAEATLEWYPVGRLVVWAALVAALVVIVAIPNFGTDADSFQSGLRGTLGAILRVETGTPTDVSSTLPSVSKADRLIELLVKAIPPAAAILATITNLLNLWLAARVVKFSGRLARPWPQLSAMSFPPLLAAVLALAFALSFADGLLGIVAGVVLASLLFGYGVLGFAVLHAITQGMNMRGLVLSLAYAAVIVVGWPILALCLLALLDTAIGLRGRIARKRGPPALS